MPVEWTVSHQRINDVASKHIAVKTHMDRLTFAMMAQADANLVAHRHDGHARVYRLYTRVDWYIILEDSTTGRGTLGAMSIEYGHGEYTRVIKRADGSSFEITVGASAPTYILTNATKIKRKGRPVKVSKAAAKSTYKGRMPDSAIAKINKIRAITEGRR
ncbi:hypothetical protein [Actinoplanes sp. NPDC026670]|uniref:hypothetical protein n=1 Tax=Actinoplanes sp. NPDC026670 TaxID=3154700 RepID=UPI0033FB337F